MRLHVPDVCKANSAEKLKGGLRPFMERDLSK
jgi:hypothetical protein